MSESAAENADLLGQVAQIIDPHPSHRAPEEVAEGVPFAGIGDLSESGELLPGKGRIVPRKMLAEHALRYKLTGNTIGFGRVATIGKVVDFRETVTDLTVSPTMAVIEPFAVDKGFLLAALEGEKVKKKIDQWLTGSTRSSLGIELLREIPLPKFYAHEQKVIGEVYSALVASIDKTEALIEKHQQIKAGLMHDLFTRGIGPDGKLRPPREQAPELYQKTPIGWIPKEWEVVGLKTEIMISHGFAFPGTGFFDAPPGEVLLTPGNFHREGGLYFTSGNTKYFRGVIPQETVITQGEIVTVMTDLSPQTLILGKFAKINTGFSVLHNQRIGLLQIKCADAWNSDYLVAALNSERIRHEIIIGATGTTVRHTSPGRILDNLIVRPQIKEQQRCSGMLQSMERKIDIEHFLSEKLHREKSGLMHDLLTGKVQVNPDPPEAFHV